MAQQIGADGLHLLQALDKPDAPETLKNEASVQLLRQVWQQYYDLSGGKAKWRAGRQENAEEGIIRSPYEPRSPNREEAGNHLVGVQSASDRARVLWRRRSLLRQASSLT